MLERKGTNSIRQVRVVTGQDTTTGKGVITYPQELTIFGVVGRATSRANPQESGSVTQTVREYLTQDPLSRGDRLVLADGTYVVSTKPTELRYKGQIIARRMVLVRLEFV